MERRYKGRRYAELDHLLTERAKTLTFKIKYFTNRGLLVWPFTVSLSRKKSGPRPFFPSNISSRPHDDNTADEFDYGLDHK